MSDPLEQTLSESKWARRMDVLEKAERHMMRKEDGSDALKIRPFCPEDTRRGRQDVRGIMFTSGRRRKGGRHG